MLLAPNLPASPVSHCSFSCFSQAKLWCSMPFLIALCLFPTTERWAFTPSCLERWSTLMVGCSIHLGFLQLHPVSVFCRLSLGHCVYMYSNTVWLLIIRKLWWDVATYASFACPYSFWSSYFKVPILLTSPKHCVNKKKKGNIARNTMYRSVELL